MWDAAAAYELRERPELEAPLEPLLDRPFADQASFAAAATDALGPEHAEHLPTVVRAADVGRREFGERFGWVESYRSELREVYAPLVQLGYAAEKQVKAEGLHGASARRWLFAVPGDALRRRRVQGFAVELMRYLHAEGHDRSAEEALLGTSDVLESLFGKYKQFSERGPLRELGPSLLLIPLATVHLTTDLVREALNAMRVKTFETLRRLTFGISSLSRRRLAFVGSGSDPDDTKPS